MFEKIKEHFTYYLSSLALLNAAAFSGFAMSQSELEEVVVTARKKTESLQASQFLYQHFVKAI